MARKNSNGGGRRHDTRMTFSEMCRALGVRPNQRVKLIKYMKTMKEGEQS